MTRRLLKEIGNLSQLRQLSLSDNQLKISPKEIGNLSQLQELWLGRNKLSKDQISEVKKLLPNTTIYVY